MHPFRFVRPPLVPGQVTEPLNAFAIDFTVAIIQLQSLPLTVDHPEKQDRLWGISLDFELSARPNLVRYNDGPPHRQSIPNLQFIGVGYLLGGAVIVEKIFALPGLGRLTLTAISQRDYALIQGATLFIAMNFVLINLVVDSIYAVVDPRISYASQK